MAQLIIAAAGAAITGAFPGVGGAIAGFAFTAIGNAIFAPTQKQQGPRLSDLKVSGTEQGQPIPYFEGKVRTSGQIAWASNRREIATTTEQGKGGGGVESTTYTYEVDLLYLLSDCEMATFARVWNNGKLVYNKLPTASVATAVASETTDLWRRITFYGGASTQLPDPTYEAAVGIGNAPAYRGRACIFIEGLQLGGSGQIPNLSFEVFRDVALADVSLTFGTFTRPSPIAYFRAAVYKKTAWFIYNATSGSPNFTILKSKNFGAFNFRRSVALNFRTSGFDPVWVQTNGAPRAVYCSFNTGSLSGGFNIEALDPETGVVTSVITYVPASDLEVCRPLQRRVAYDEIKGVYVMCGAAVNGQDPDSPYIITGTGYVRCPAISGLNCIAAYNGYFYALANQSGAWRVRRYDYTGTYVDEVVDSTAAFAGSDLISNGSWIRVDSDGQCWVCSPYHGRLFKITTFFEEVSTAANVQAYNTNSQDGVFYCEPGFVAFGLEQVGSGPYTLNYTFRRFKSPTALQPTLQSVVERLCARADLDPAQYDATGLSTITRPVRSMAISQVTPIRQVIETLAGAFYFGGTLSDKLYFRPRGGSSVATIPYLSLGAGEGGAASEPLNLKLSNDLEIPAQIALTYSNVDGDYNVATEYSDRLLTGQTSTSAVQLPLGMTPAEAKGTVDSLVADSAAAIFTTTVALTSEYAHIEPTDVLSIIDRDGSSYRMRVTQKTEAGPVITLELVLDDASALTSSGITSPAYVDSTTVAGSADTLLRLLDIPILRDADDDVGIYAAFAGDSTPWPGAALYKSPDNSVFALSQTATDGAGMGATTTALTTWAGGFVFDETSSVTVLMDSGALSSYTRDQIFDGTAPAYLIGSEIVFAKSAALIAANTYALTGFLRGMRGTEWAMAGHSVSENFTVLSSSGIRRETMTASEIGALRYFKAPTLGRALSTADVQSIALAALGKKPFSPVGLRGSFGLPEPFFSSVSLLLHFDGTNGQTTTTDSGPLARSVTLTGSTLSTTTPKFGTASLNLSSSSYADIAGATSLEMGAGDFTVECWVWFSATSADATIMIYDNGTATASSIQFLMAQAGTSFNFQWFIAGVSYSITGGTATTSQWIHLAAVRSGSTMNFYVDGVSVGSNTFGTGSLNAPVSAVLRLGYRVNNVLPFTGRIDDLRVTKGIARYTANFTPPAAAFPDLAASPGVTLSWDRRTRLAKNFTNGYVPLGEATEAYEIDIWSSNTYTTLKRTLTSGSASVNYSAAQQVADFGVTQSVIYADVYQVSPIVGRGYRLRGAV